MPREKIPLGEEGTVPGLGWALNCPKASKLSRKWWVGMPCTGGAHTGLSALLHTNQSESPADPPCPQPPPLAPCSHQRNAAVGIQTQEFWEKQIYYELCLYWQRLHGRVQALLPFLREKTHLYHGNLTQETHKTDPVPRPCSLGQLCPSWVYLRLGYPDSHTNLPLLSENIPQNSQHFG